MGPGLNWASFGGTVVTPSEKKLYTGEGILEEGKDVGVGECT
jgi:hypothetical protein